MEKINFDDCKERIKSEIDSRSSQLGINEPVTLINGFTYLPIQKEISGNIRIGGPSIPAIMLVGSNTGRIYLFALKAIIKD